MSVPKEYNMVVKRLQIKKFQALSGFKAKFLQRVRFQNKIFGTFQIFDQNFYNVSDFLLKKLFKNQILHKKNVHSKNHVLTEFTHWKGRILQFLSIFEKHDSDAKNIVEGQVFNKNFTTCQGLN